MNAHYYIRHFWVICRIQLLNLLDSWMVPLFSPWIHNAKPAQEDTCILRPITRQAVVFQASMEHWAYIGLTWGSHSCLDAANASGGSGGLFFQTTAPCRCVFSWGLREYSTRINHRTVWLQLMLSLCINTCTGRSRKKLGKKPETMNYSYAESLYLMITLKYPA